ncbi:arylsulfatase [candidate division KSB1 bacterium]|nr:sulfatase-like hydrolase/transferase [candidate division KSB1 bacterium]RQW05033.1 MAG: arylsulfatase [candidate division KSB1 bacterium]
MQRRQFLKTAALAGLATAALTRRCAKPGIQKPNILLIVADDLGYECIRANGGTSYATPALDDLAATGVRFEHCYAQPLCTPSRVKIMTGIYNVRNYRRFGILDRNQTTFAHLFKQQGYATCVAGKWQLGKETDSPQHFGFDESCLWQHRRGRTDEDGHDTRYPNPKLEINGEPVDFNNGEFGPDVVSDFLCDFIERHLDQPFFAYYPMILTHCPFVPTPESSDWDPTDRGSLAYKGDPKYFADMVRCMDKMVGKVVNKLQALGLRERTLILFTGDNGTDEPIVSVLNGRQVAGAKGHTTDAGTRVPLIANWPGTVIAGEVCRDLVDFCDVLPTLCQAADIPIPKAPSLDGVSFWPQLQGKSGSPRESIYCWYSRSGQEKEARVFARTHRYKLYRSGEFYDIDNDVLEQQPLDITSLDAPALEMRARLQHVIDAQECRNNNPASS